MADEEIVVRFKDVENAIFDGVSSNRELKRIINRFVDDVESTWKHVWDSSMQGKLAEELGIPHPYQTGEYRAHIKKKKMTLFQKMWVKRALRKGFLVGSVYNDDDKAHWIEYGTMEDKPGSRSPWGPHTPTPEFAPMRRTWAIMNDEGEIR
ncbi:hypothetical protein [Mycobacterium phage WXIN]|nr:hypothetical protein [Mycobacterium phage WXIN]